MGFALRLNTLVPARVRADVIASPMQLQTALLGSISSRLRTLQHETRRRFGS